MPREVADARGDVTVILLAAGSARRMGGIDKVAAELAGEPLAAHALRALVAVEGVSAVVIVAPEARREVIHAALARACESGSARVELRWVEGGERRQDSVAAAIAAAPDAGWYLVHDAARPLVTRELAAAVLAAARATAGAAIAAIPVSDTIKRVDAGGRVVETLDRAALRAVQTPQAFAGELLRRAHHEVSHDVTDDAGMVEHLGIPVAVVDGDPQNMKVTTPGDLALVCALLATRGGGSGATPISAGGSR